MPNLLPLIQSISSRLATVGPAVLERIRKTLNISSGGDILGKIRKFIAENPVSAATVASILATEAPDVIGDMMVTESKDVQDSLKELLPELRRYAPDPESVMGDRTTGISGVDIDSLSKDANYVKLAIDRTEFIAGQLSINPKRVGALVAAIMAYEPQDQKIYNLIKG